MKIIFTKNQAMTNQYIAANLYKLIQVYRKCNTEYRLMWREKDRERERERERTANQKTWVLMLEDYILNESCCIQSFQKIQESIEVIKPTKYRICLKCLATVLKWFSSPLYLITYFQKNCFLESPQLVNLLLLGDHAVVLHNYKKQRSITSKTLIK